LGVGVWALGSWPQPPIPNPQSPIPNPHIEKILVIFYKCISFLIIIAKKKIKYEK